MSQYKHTFSIDKQINPETGRPFGNAFAGDFTVRRPTLDDNEVIARISKGTADLASSVANLGYIFAQMAVIGEAVPEWFDKSKLFEEDEPAVYFVWGEVSHWLATFRSKADPALGDGAGGESGVLVP